MTIETLYLSGILFFMLTTVIILYLTRGITAVRQKENAMTNSILKQISQWIEESKEAVDTAATFDFIDEELDNAINTAKSGELVQSAVTSTQ